MSHLILQRSQEVDQLNTKIAQSIISGKLNANPFLQGLLVQCLRSLDRDVHAKSSRGRWKDLSVTEEELVRDAALTLSMHNKNVQLCSALGQNARPPTLQLDKLFEHGLPNPALALMSKEQMARNLEIIDQQLPRLPEWPQSRLIMAVDCTYLLKSYSQMRIGDVDGLVGGPWSPTDLSEPFLPFGELNAASREKASVMLLALVWDPHLRRRRGFPLAAMPMRLGPNKGSEKTLVNAGNRETWISSVCIRLIPFVVFNFFSEIGFCLLLWKVDQEMLHVIGLLLEAGAHLIRGITFDAHNSHAWFREALFGVFEKLDEQDLAGVPFWKNVRYDPLPAHALPRLPIRILLHQGNPIIPLPGACPLGLRLVRGWGAGGTI